MKINCTDRIFCICYIQLPYALHKKRLNHGGFVMLYKRHANMTAKIKKKKEKKFKMPMTTEGK